MTRDVYSIARAEYGSSGGGKADRAALEGVSRNFGVEGGPSMPAPVCDERFLMRIFAALVVATIMADIGLIWAVFGLPAP